MVYILVFFPNREKSKKENKATYSCRRPAGHRKDNHWI